MSTEGRAPFDRAVVLVPVEDASLARAALAPVTAATAIAYDGDSEAAAVPVARGLAAVPPTAVVILGSGRPLGPASDLPKLAAIAWAVRGNLLPDRVRADEQLTDALVRGSDARRVGAVATPRWLARDDAGRAEAARIASHTGAALENPACFSLLGACARLSVPAAMLVAIEPDVLSSAIEALARALSSK